MIDKNSRLCSKDVQQKLLYALDKLNRVSLDYALRHNLVEKACIECARKAINDLITRRRYQLHG